MLAVKLGIAAALTLAFAGPSQAQSPAAQRGLTFVRTNCAQCHAIDKVSASPLRIAPPFREPASPVPGRIPRRGAGRRHQHWSSHDAGISARSWPDRRCHRLPENFGAVVINHIPVESSDAFFLETTGAKHAHYIPISSESGASRARFCCTFTHCLC